MNSERAEIFFNQGNEFCSEGLYNQAAEKYAQAWQIWGVDLAHRKELREMCAIVLMNWANTLDAQGHFEQAAEKYAQAWQIRSVDLANHLEVPGVRATLLMDWALTLNSKGCYEQAAEKCAQAWEILVVELKHRPDVAPSLFELALNCQILWGRAPNGQIQAERLSAELCRRLADQNLASPPDWLNELYQGFAEFHLRWMQDSLDLGNPENLVNVLSRVSSWRMAAALSDELETMVPAKVGDDAAKDLQHYQRMRLEVRRWQQLLQEKENTAGLRGTDFSGNRNFKIDEHESSAEVQALLKEDADILRAEYDRAYTQMQLARNEAAEVPGYEALSMDRHVLDSQKLLAQLEEGQAILIVFDHQTAGDKPDETQQLSGALLLKDREVHWHPIDDIAQGSAFLCKFEVLVDNKRAGGMRGSGGEDNGIGLSSLNGFEPVYGDFRRGDTPIAATTVVPSPMVYQGQTIDRENLWKLFGSWVEDTVWRPLKQKGLLDGVQELALVTQGQDAHAIPWQMGAPIPSTAIRRYPGLIFYAMATEIMSRAVCSDEPMLGIAHYQGSENPLPFARIEAHILGQIWAHSERTTLQNFDFQKPQGNAGHVHVAGHGCHLHNTHKQTATAGLSVGMDTYWGLAQLMNSPSRPKEVYLSCCVAGRTTDLAGEQYGVTSALLQHGTRNVVASSVSLSDIWGSVLSIATHCLMQQDKLSMREALHQGQMMVTGERNWDPAAWEWVRQAFEIRLSEMEPIPDLLQRQLTPLLDKLQREKTSMGSDFKLARQLGNEMQETMYFPHLSLLQFDHHKWFGWVTALACELRTHNGQADEAMLRSIVQRHTAAFRETLAWIDKAPTHIGGSLAYATVVYG